MEQNNYRDEFEQFLRGCTDDFIMIPARKVWHGIYNDVHPAKRWPSLAIALLILISILFVGVSNNNNINNASQYAALVFAANTATTNVTTILKTTSTKNLLENSKQTNRLFSKNNNNKASNINKELAVTPADFYKNNNTFLSNVINATVSNKITKTNKPYKNKIQPIGSLNILVKKELENTTEENTTENLIINSLAFNSKENNKPVFKNIDKRIAIYKENKTINTATYLVTKNIEDKKDKKEIIPTENTNEEQAWKENYAFKNKPKLYFPKPSKTITYYLTPSYGFRTKAKNSNIKSTTTATNSSMLASSVFVGDKEIQNDNAALSVELGAAVKYAITKKTFFKIGAQINYTNYVSNATSIGHTTQAKVATTNGENMLGISSYTTEKGKDALNNTTLQIVIPFGFDVKIVGGKTINWYLGAVVQPSYTFGGSAFLYSDDGKNYITDFSMVRKLNINTAIETFITYKASSDIILQFGPQIRYQLFSTYKNEYNYKENLYNLGVKIGVTRSF